VRLSPPLVALFLAAACSTASVPSVAAPVTTTATPAPTRSVALRSSPSAVPPPVWVVGASPLPLGSNGFGQVLPTPKVLRNRSLPTVDVLPPPRDGLFHDTTGPITAGLRTRMGATYQPGCPVPLSKLTYLTLSFHGFDHRVHTGELVVATSAASKTTLAFRRLFSLGFPLEQMTLPTGGDVAAPPTGDGNTTAGFICRKARGLTRFSAHAYGLAIDVNPFDNPYVKGDLVLPELASAYADRRWARPGMFLRGSAAVRAFTDEGFTWGGAFRSLKDYQHMSLTGD
jgi:hypothetical protein